MDGELITAIAAAGVSAGAAGIAVWQSRIAARSAGSAKIQAKAAEEQVELMRRQLDAEDSERHQAAGPQFAVTAAHTDTHDSSFPYGVLVLRQESGPALASVRITASGTGVEGLRGQHHGEMGRYHHVHEIDLGSMAAGTGTKTVQVALDYDHQETTIILHMECRAHDGRVWDRSVSSDVAPAPEPPRRSPFLERRGQ
ncbi:hypothetical protein [Streptomyces hydrogenans]|uniref:hypothetical protein n=1 Tax=Streptomyces hydrogenans TaxID=1873719 RepID=UPI0034224E6C